MFDPLLFGHLLAFTDVCEKTSAKVSSMAIYVICGLDLQGNA
jgi:hypothetical protein